MPGVEPARDVPGAEEMPDTKIVHKVVFDMATAGPKPGEVHPMLQAVARYVNTLAKTGRARIESQGRGGVPPGRHRLHHDQRRVQGAPRGAGQPERAR